MTEAPDLNPEQQLVVNHGTGPLRVGAVAGAGKTTALVERVVHLICKKRVPVNRILMISFSKSAAQQMKRRIEKRLPGCDAGRCAKTFHSIGLQVFKAEGDPHNEKYVDTSGLLYLKAIAQAYKGLQLEPEKRIAKAFASTVKNNLLGTSATLRRLGKLDERMVRVAEDLAEGELLDAAAIIEAYFATELIREKTGVEYNGMPVTFVTFDDMIYQAAMLLAQKDVRERWGARWSHVLQDECQDENEAQAAIAEALCHKHRNYMVVGDPAQAVFGFRGARPEKMLAFEEEWPGAKTVVMHRNYRSGIEIVDLANRIMGHMPVTTVITDDMGVAADMVSERGTSSYVGYHTFEAPEDEATAVVDNIVAHSREGVRWDEQSVLMRMNFMTRAIEMALARERVPYKLVSGQSFFTMKETKVLLGYLRVIAGRATEAHLGDALMFPGRGIGRAFVKKVVEHHGTGSNAEMNGGGDWIATVRKVARMSSQYQARQAVGWTRLIEAWRKERLSPADLLNKVRVDVKLDAWLSRNVDEGEDSKASDNLNEVIAFARNYGTVDSMLDAVDEIENHRAACARKRNAVTVSTVHRSKGMEWQVVYLIHVADGFFPASRAELSEERRLFYVACTRAKDELWVSTPAQIRGEGVSESGLISEAELEESVKYTIGVAARDTAVGTQMELV